MTAATATDSAAFAHAFCEDGEGWRIGPLLADSPGLAAYLIRMLQQRHPGVLLMDTPGFNSACE